MCNPVLAPVALAAAAVLLLSDSTRAEPACGGPATPIHAVQSGDRSSPLAGREVAVEAVVVGVYPELGGFFLQEEDADVDADPGTSEGIFVYDARGGPGLRVGQVARVEGRVREFFGLTELGGPPRIRGCPGRAPAGAARVVLPLADGSALERFEGMRVRLAGPLVATDLFDLGRFGELGLAYGGALSTPTHVVAPGAPARARAEANVRRRILLDDGSRAFDPRPVPYLGATRTLRRGDWLPALEGILDFAFGRFRVHPVPPEEMGRARAFSEGAPRPTQPPRVAGRLRVAALNLENFMNGDGQGGGFPTRGARSPEELDRQRAGLVATLAGLDADVLVLVELENDGAGAGSALVELVEALSRASGDGFVAVDPGRGLGGHAIAVGIAYREDAVVPVGPAAVLDAAHPGFDDRRHRPALAQTFETREPRPQRFSVVAVHLKSKGSACPSDPDRGDGQGPCNRTRREGARALTQWLATDPTDSGDPDVLVLGDLNAYPQEDPLAALREAGLVDLFRAFGRDPEHTYVFSGEAGRLDHALASPSLRALVSGVAVWHVNADEPPVLGYREASPLSAPGFRSSDHDPILVGLFPDADGDGVVDALDACPRSDPAPDLRVGRCRTGIPDPADAEGCRLGDRLRAELTGARGGGARRRILARWLRDFVRQGLLAPREAGHLAACMAGGGPASRDLPRRRVTRTPGRAPRGG